jgi:type II secretory pathway pseudopilin PulG
MADVESRQGAGLRARPLTRSFAPDVKPHTDQMKNPSQIQSRILRQVVRERLPQDRGWTLIELLISISMMLTLFFAALPIIDGAANTEGRIQTAAFSIGDARVFSDQVLRDLRPATGVVGNPSTPRPALTVDTFVRHSCGSGNPSAEDDPPTPCRVAYSCSGGTCTRQEEGGPTVTMITGLSNDIVFSPEANTYDQTVFVGITIELPSQQDPSEDAITLQDGTALRNVGAT